MAPISRRAFWKAKLAASCQHAVSAEFKNMKHTLLVFAQFTLQCADVLNTVFEYHALCRELLVDFLAQVVCTESVWKTGQRCI